MKLRTAASLTLLAVTAGVLCAGCEGSTAVEDDFDGASLRTTATSAASTASTASTASAAGATPVLTAQDLTPPPMERALGDARVAEILDLWLEEEPDAELLEASLAEVEDAVDLRFVAPLIEMTWGAMLQIVHFGQHHADVLQALTAQPFGRDWERWLE